MMKQKLWWCRRGLNLLKKFATLSFSFMVVEFDSKVSPEAFGRSAGCDFFKKIFNF
jgi:hypothetical protein